MMTVPDMAIGALDGLYYKIGRHGYAYYWNGEEWVKSEKHPDIVVSDINNRGKDKFNLT